MNIPCLPLSLAWKISNAQIVGMLRVTREEGRLESRHPVLTFAVPDQD